MFQTLPHVDKGTVDLPSSCKLGSVELVLEPVRSELAYQVYWASLRGEGRGGEIFKGKAGKLSPLMQ